MANAKKKFSVTCQVNLDTNKDNYKTLDIEASGKNAAERMAISKLLNDGYFHACVVTCNQLVQH